MPAGLYGCIGSKCVAGTGRRFVAELVPALRINRALGGDVELFP